MAEEHRCQAPCLCPNNCGFFGSPATENLCSKCYRDLQLKEQQSSSAKQALSQSLTSSTSSPLTSASVTSPDLDLSEFVKTPSVVTEQKDDKSTAKKAEPETQEEERQPPPPPNRCWTCRKRVGLTGFKCRCGSVLCGTHRYPELHNCSFDFKTMGKDQIAKANPIIKADKLEKI